VDDSEWFWYKGQNVVDVDGETLGTIHDLLVDPATGQAHWASVVLHVAENRRTLVPLAEAVAEGDSIKLVYDAQTVLGAPDGNASLLNLESRDAGRAALGGRPRDWP
jgi:hypothetical protein